jgi:PBSX family phage terminase large subunit
MEKVKIKWPAWDDIIPDKFIPLIDNKDRFLILYGGRGSAKSESIAKILIFRCMYDEYFKCILVRKTYNSIRETQWETLRSIINDWNLQEFFDVLKSPLEIIYKPNGNKFIARGCDDVSKIKSIRNPTTVWYEEDIIDEDDFIIISSGLRTQKAKLIQEIFTINPEVEGDYKDNWFWKRFFEGHLDKSFRDTQQVQTEEDGIIDITYTAHHSTWRDNPWLPAAYKAYLMDYKRTDAYYYEIYAEGNWGNKKTDGQLFKKFNRSKICNNTTSYNGDLPLHISFDFNNHPYLSLSIWQIESNDIKCIDEIAGKYPNNSIKSVCRDFTYRYSNHEAGLFIYGDPSGKNQDTKSERGHNNFTEIELELAKYKPNFRIATKHPAVVPSVDFCNKLFEDGYNDLKISISENCIYLINDLMFLKEASDGGKFIEKGSKNGITYEKWGHFSDGMRYFITEAFKQDYNSFNRGPEAIREHIIIAPNTKWRY